MTKELEYIQRHINIVKQQVKGSKMKIIVTDAVTKHQYDYYENELQTLENIEQALHRLESIDNANPSEALECLEWIIKNYIGNDYYVYEEELITIKQALLKAQEPKKYLKWEDLEFTKKSKEMLVKLGDTTYPMRYYKVNDNTNKVCISSFQFIEIYDIRFFNDLHLERVEE